ncbi:hypothetical protein [Methanopyrus sp.]
MSERSRALVRAKAVLVGLLVAAMGVKAAFHGWVAATTHFEKGDRLVMKVRNVPCYTGADLRPGHVEVYARVYGVVKYLEIQPGRSDPRRVLVPVLPPRFTAPIVTVNGNVIRVFESGISAPFVVITEDEPPRLYVDQYEIRVRSPCKILVQPHLVGLLRHFPPVYVIEGEFTRRPVDVTCRSVAIILPYAAPVIGKIATDLASVVSISGDRLIINTHSVYAPKGAVIRWAPLRSLFWTTYFDVTWRWPHWPYPL